VGEQRTPILRPVVEPPRSERRASGARCYRFGDSKTVVSLVSMGSLDGAVVRHYEAIQEENRIAHGSLELLRVEEVLRRRLAGPPARVLDVGGATGVHAR